MSTLPRMMLPNHGRVSSMMVLPARVLRGCQMGKEGVVGGVEVGSGNAGVGVGQVREVQGSAWVSNGEG